MSHYYPSMTEQKHTWHWVHQAISLAQTAGLHRDPGNHPQRRLWARIWWACLVRDRLICIGTGRPMHINSLDCDVPMLKVEDLCDSGDSDLERKVKVIFIELVKLCQYMEGVLSLHHPNATTSNATSEQISVCNQALNFWYENLLPEARRQEELHQIPGQDDNIATLYRAILHSLYQ